MAPKEEPKLNGEQGQISVIIQEMSSIKDMLGNMKESIAELKGAMEKDLEGIRGRLKGNKELLEKDLDQFVTKTECHDCQQKTALRFAEFDKEMELLKKENGDNKEKADKKEATTLELVSSWAPGIFKAIIYGVAAIIIATKGQIFQ